MRVLVIEDEAELATDLIGVLGAAGFVADRAADGEEAWKRGAVEPYDAAILDLGLPHMDGLSGLRRASGMSKNIQRIGNLVLDLRTQRLTMAGRHVDLTPLEFRILAYLVQNRGRAVHQTELVDHVYASDAERSDNAVEAVIARLRRKLGSEVVRTRRGHGYVPADGA